MVGTVSVDPMPRPWAGVESIKKPCPSSARAVRISPLGKQLSDPAARTSQSPHLASIVDHHLKTKLTAQLFQFRHAALSAVAKTKIGALMNLDRPQRIMNNRSDKFRGPHAGKFRGEGKHQHRIDAGIPQQLQFRFQGRNQLGTSLRT